MSDQNAEPTPEGAAEAAPASSLQGNIIRVVILLALVAGLGFAVLRIKAKNEANAKIMDINAAKVDVPAKKTP